LNIATYILREKCFVNENEKKVVFAFLADGNSAYRLLIYFRVIES